MFINLSANNISSIRSLDRIYVNWNGNGNGNGENRLLSFIDLSNFLYNNI